MKHEVHANKDSKHQIIYAAYCFKCALYLEECPNGSFAEAAAERHTMQEGHDTIVGFTFSRWNVREVK